jgi:negative regulator of sigma E activity
MKLSLPVCAGAFLLMAGAISWGVLSDAHEAELQRLLTSVESAEQDIPYLGTRLMGGAETVKLRILSREGHKRIDFLGVEGASRPTPRASALRLPFGGGLPAVLRPGGDQWKRKVKDAALAVRNYDISMSGRGSVAGRDCDVIEIRARHPGRPSYRVLSDAVNRFPLRYEVLSEGRPIFESRFSEIQYNPPPPAGGWAERRLPAWLKVSQEQVGPERICDVAGFAVLRPTHLPEGFQIRGSELIRVSAEISQELRETLAPFLPFPLPKLDATVVHFTYTDGLAAVALVECSAASNLWQSLKKFIPGSPTRIAGDRVLARKFTDRGGSAYLLEVEGTVILAAGTMAAEEIESMIGTLEGR